VVGDVHEVGAVQVLVAHRVPGVDRRHLGFDREGRVGEALADGEPTAEPNAGPRMIEVPRWATEKASSVCIVSMS
jgi:hypothetical protein